MKRGVTLVEILLACAVAFVGITVALMLAADVLRAGARVRERNAENASALVAMYRLRGEVLAAQAFSQNGNALAVTSSTGGIRWQVATFGNVPYLTRVKSAGTPAIKNAVAGNVSEISAERSANAVTLAITAGQPGRRVRINEVIRTWGVTL